MIERIFFDGGTMNVASGRLALSTIVSSPLSGNSVGFWQPFYNDGDVVTVYQTTSPILISLFNEVYTWNEIRTNVFLDGATFLGSRPRSLQFGFKNVSDGVFRLPVITSTINTAKTIEYVTSASAEHLGGNNYKLHIEKATFNFSDLPLFENFCCDLSTISENTARINFGYRLGGVDSGISVIKNLYVDGRTETENELLSGCIKFGVEV